MSGAVLEMELERVITISLYDDWLAPHHVGAGGKGRGRWIAKLKNAM